MKYVFFGLALLFGAIGLFFLYHTKGTLTFDKDWWDAVMFLGFGLFGFISLLISIVAFGFGAAIYKKQE